MFVLYWFAFDLVIDIFWGLMGVGYGPVGVLLRVVPSVTLAYLAVWYLPAKRKSGAPGPSSNVAPQPPVPSTPAPEVPDQPAVPPPSPLMGTVAQMPSTDATSTASSDLFCPYCGAETGPDWSFCRSCGKRVGSGAAVPNAEVVQPSLADQPMAMETMAEAARPAAAIVRRPPDAGQTTTSTPAEEAPRKRAWIVIAVVIVAMAGGSPTSPSHVPWIALRMQPTAAQPQSLLRARSSTSTHPLSRARGSGRTRHRYREAGLSGPIPRVRTSHIR